MTSINDIIEGTDHRDLLPEQTSVSALGTFTKCPKQYFYSRVARLPTKPSVASAKGNLTHLVFERVLDFPPEKRTPARAVKLIPSAWQDMVNPPEDASARDKEAAVKFDELAPQGSSELAELFADVERFVRNWFNMEKVHMVNAAEVPTPSGETVDGRELAVVADVAGTSWRGFVDRFEHYTGEKGERCWAVSDYKTGKVPSPRFLGEYFFQLRMYASMLRASRGITPSMLRLVFVAGGSPSHIFHDKEYAADPERVLEQTESAARRTWLSVVDTAKAGVWPANPSQLCGWCDFSDICPAVGGDGAGLPVDE